MLPLATKLGSNKILISLRDGIIIAMPLIIIGSLFLVISGIAIPGWIEWLEQQGIQQYLLKAILIKEKIFLIQPFFFNLLF